MFQKRFVSIVRPPQTEIRNVECGERLELVGLSLALMVGELSGYFGAFMHAVNGSGIVVR